MSVTLNNLEPQSGTEIVFNAAHQMQHQGKVVQTQTVTTHVRTTYSANNSGNGNVITQLNLLITPYRADSYIWLRWTVAYEMHNNASFVVQRDGTLIGYNLDIGNTRWSNILTPQYDNDYSSTPQVSTINWFDPAGSTAARTYQLAVRSSGGSNHTFALNRTLGSTGTDGHEIGVSHGIAREISG
jgi:hypothetical protein